MKERKKETISRAGREAEAAALAVALNRVRALCRGNRDGVFDALEAFLDNAPDPRQLADNAEGWTP